MYAEERRRQIASLTAIEGRVNVTELAARFDVTAETIRRDLAVLDNEGTVHRVHGGAVASQNFQTAELTVDARAKSASSAKSAIARAALDFLPAAQGGMFLDAGTTLAPLAELIADHPNARQWSIVTNCLPIAMSLASAGLERLPKPLWAIRHYALWLSCVPTSRSSAPTPLPWITVFLPQIRRKLR